MRGPSLFFKPGGLHGRGLGSLQLSRHWVHPKPAWRNFLWGKQWTIHAKSSINVGKIWETMGISEYAAQNDAGVVLTGCLRLDSLRLDIELHRMTMEEC